MMMLCQMGLFRQLSTYFSQLNDQDLLQTEWW